MTRAAELAELDDDELQNRLANSRRELLNLRFQLATGQLDNTQRLGDVRRDIARALTILRERDLTEAYVELEPLVPTPVRRPVLDDSGGLDEDAETEEPDEDDAGLADTDDYTADDEAGDGAADDEVGDGAADDEVGDSAADDEAGDGAADAGSSDEFDAEGDDETEDFSDSEPGDEEGAQR